MMLAPEAMRGEEAVQAERDLLGLLLLHPTLTEFVEEEVGPTDFLIPAHGRLMYEFLSMTSGGGEKLEIDRLITAAQGSDPEAEFFGGQTAAQYIASLMAMAPRCLPMDVPDAVRALARQLRNAVDRENGLLPVEAEPPTPETFRSRFGALWFHQLDGDTHEQHEWLVDDWLSAGDKSLVYGASRSGKSFLAIYIAFCVARGTPFFGHKVLKRGGVIYQAGEGAKGIANRLRAYRKYHGLKRDEKLPFVMLRSPVNIWSKEGDTKALIEEIKALARMMPEKLRLVVIDTLATATPGADENSGRDMSLVMDHVALISRECDCHVMLVHHKNAGGDRPRGHTSVFAGIDNAIEVVRDQKTGIRTAINGKQKDGEEATPIRFELKRIVVGYRGDGKEISSCVCVEVGDKEFERAAEKAEGFKLKAQEATAFKALLDALAEHGQEPPASVGAPPGTRAVEYKHWRDAFVRLDASGEEDEKRQKERVKKALQRAGETFLQYRIIGRSNPWLWLTWRPVRGFTQARQPHPADNEAPPTTEAVPHDEEPAL